jgi:WD40 repeat protein
VASLSEVVVKSSGGARNSLGRRLAIYDIALANGARCITLGLSASLPTGQAIRTLEGHIRRVLGVAVTADGRFAISASRDRTLKVWDLATGQTVRTLEGHTSDVNGVVVMADGRFAVSASHDKTLKVWNLATGR